MGSTINMDAINMGERAVKGTVFDIRRFSTHDGGGIRTTVFLKGCTLSCVWCHNPEGIRLDISKQENWDQIIEECPSGAIVWDSKRMSVDEVVEEVLKDAPFYKYGGGVTLSGGEPLLQPEFVLSFLKEMKKRNIHTAVETALHVPEKTLESEKRDQVIIRTPMIPGVTTGEDNIAEISRFISEAYSEVSYEILNYNPLAEAKYRLIDKTYCFKENPKRYSRKDMECFAEIARSNGVKNIIIES